MSTPDRLVVAAAVVERDGAYLVTRRPRGVHLEGCWEFPGGKCEVGESHADCLTREMVEELDAAVLVHHEVFSVTHAYTDRIVELHFYACTLTSDLRPQLGQDVRWVRREELSSLEFPAADEDLIRRLQAGID